MSQSSVLCSGVLSAALGLLLAAKAPAVEEVVYTQTQSTVGGKPFMPRGIFGVNPPDFSRVAAYGFNVVQTYQFSSMTDEQVAAYLDGATANGLRVLFHLNAAIPDEAIVEKVRSRVVRFKKHPALYAWYLADEPSVARTTTKAMTDLYGWIKKEDPAHPVWSSNWELNNFKDACDADMPQLYSGPPSGLRAGNLPRQARIAAETGVPWIGIANTHDITDFRPYDRQDAVTMSPALIWKSELAGQPADAAGRAARAKVALVQSNLSNPPFKTLASYPDSPVKVRAQALDFIAHGSNGLFYWLLQPEDSIHQRYGYYTIFVRPHLRIALKDVLREMDELWPRIGNPSTNSQTWYEEEFGNVFYWSRRQNDSMTVIAVNESDVDWQVVRTTLPGLEGTGELTAEVKGENRTVKVKDGAIEDLFRADQAHVYLIEVK